MRQQNGNLYAELPGVIPVNEPMSRATRLFRLLLATVLVTGNGAAVAASMNGFALDNASVPLDKIERGGPPRDGIVALTGPRMVNAEDARLQDDARVLGLIVNGSARAYPVRYLTVHEIVNDREGEQFYTVTYCPLCGSGVAFATNVRTGVHLNFGVSGLLYNSDLLMYDRNTESLWSQMSATAIAGPLVGTALPRLPLSHTSWSAWREQHPHSLVMTGHPKFRAAYRVHPYPGYARSRRLYFAVEHEAPKEFHPKDWVLGVMIGAAKKAYPFVELDKHGQKRFTDHVGNTPVVLEWDPDHQTASARVDGEPLAATQAYWFAWYAFHPDTEVFRAAD